jgi:hypothetical protein
MGGRSVRWEVVVVRNRDEEVAVSKHLGGEFVEGEESGRWEKREDGRPGAGVFGYHLVVSSYLFCFLFLLEKKCLVSENSDIWFF